MEYTLKQLRYALAVAETGHFGQAAEQCHVTQSALSQQIKQLEQTCGARLFERGSREVRVTPFGREFLSHAEKIVRDTEALARFAEQTGGQPNRPIRFGLIPTVAPYLLPEILPLLRQQLPDIRFELREGHTDLLLDQLDRGELDLALIATDPPDPNRLDRAELFADPFVAAMPRNRHMSAPVDLTSIPHDQILLLNEGHCFRDQAMAVCSMRDGDAHTFAATSLSTIMELVANGQGMTLLPAISLKKEGADPRIAIAPLDASGASRTLSLVWQRATPFDTLFHQIANCVRTAGQERLVEPLADGSQLQEQQ